MKNQTLIIILSVLLITAIGFIAWQNIFQERSEDVVVVDTDIESFEEGVELESSEEFLEEDGLTIGSARSLIVGEWQSTEDPQSVIHFRANGEMNDIYAGGAVNESGTYQLFDSANSLPQEVLENSPDLGEDHLYLRQSFGTEDYYYIIDKLDSDVLSMFYLSRGNILEYRRLD